jgi:transposase-like protein
MNATRRRARYTIAELLESRNVAGLARELGKNPSTVFRWRDGKTRPGGKALQQLAAACGVEASRIDLPPPRRDAEEGS